MGGIAPAGTIQPEPSGARPKRPRGFSRAPERETSEPEAGVAARFRRRDGRSSGARFPANRSRKHISHDRRNNRQRVSLLPPKRWAESLRRERFSRSHPSGFSPKVGAVSIFFPGRWTNRQRQTTALAIALGRLGPRRFFSATNGAIPFFPGRAIQRQSPSSFLARTGWIFFSVATSVLPLTGEAIRCGPPISEARRAESLSLCLSRAVLCGNAKRTEARCGARIAGTNLGPTGRTPSPRSSPPMGARMHSSCVEMLARTRALEAVQPSALTISRPCPTLAKVPNVPFKARCLCPGTPSTKRSRFCPWIDKIPASSRGIGSGRKWAGFESISRRTPF